MKTNLHCHNCNGYFDAEFDDTINGDHIVYCPKCGHDHYRTIKDGVVTESRWGQSPTQQQLQGVYLVQGTASNWTSTSSATSVNVYYSGNTSGTYIASAWYGTTSTATY